MQPPAPAPSVGLLIVPYGIETAQRGGMHYALITLLIVPYGIETKAQCAFTAQPRTFNCTLWN